MVYYSHIENFVKKSGIRLASESGKSADIGVKKKWLTEEDTQIEQEFTQLIKELDTESVVYGEELGGKPDTSNLWIIDPISHTVNFIHGLPHYAICVSHVVKGQIVFGLVYDPSVDEMFTATRGEGAFLNGEKINVKNWEGDRIILYEHENQVGYQSQRNKDLYSYLITQGRIKTIGSMGLHYAYVACGRVDAAVHVIKDVFPEYAGKILVEEAGGKFTDFNGGELNFETRDIVATNGSIILNFVNT